MNLFLLMTIFIKNLIYNIDHPKANQ